MASDRVWAGEFRQCAAARAGGAVGVPDGQGEVPGCLVLVAEPGAEFLGELQQTPSVLYRVEDVMVVAPLSARRLRDRLGLDGTGVLGVGVEGAAGGGAEDAGGGWQGCVGEVADGVQPLRTAAFSLFRPGG